MHILRLPINEIEVWHLEELVTARARESGVLEFKETLPFERQKGQPHQADRWIERGDRIGDYARDEILSEIVAFANANGGTLVLGVVESKGERREAIGLKSLPKCELLAQRLHDAAEDMIEPRLPLLQARGMPINEAGDGYVVLRTGRSRAGPHRLNGRKREFYVRRGERTVEMDVREIKALTLELARSDERLELELAGRRQAAREKFEAVSRLSPHYNPPLLARVTALPTLAEYIEGLTGRQELWWKGRPFQLRFESGETYDIDFPARDFAWAPRIQLRSLVHHSERLDRILNASGLVEAVLTPLGPRKPAFGSAEPEVYVSWLLSLVGGVLAQIEHLRRELGWNAVEYGLEVELLSQGPIHLRWGNHDLGITRYSPALPLTFPLYSVRDVGTFDGLINEFLQDLFNAWKTPWNRKGSIDWQSLLS